MGYCSKHYNQYKVHKEIFKRTRFDENEFINFDTYLEMILFDKNGKLLNVTKIDLDDFEKVSKYKWSLSSSTGYVYGHINNKKVALHRYVMNVSNENILIDHINRDRLDNRKSNLRNANVFENAWNSVGENESGVKGVNFEKSKSKWRARLFYKKKCVLDKLYVEFEDAVKARLKAEKEYYQDFAPQIHLFSRYIAENK